MAALVKLLGSLRRTDTKGVTAIEYALIASLIAVAIITAAALLGTNISATFNNIASHL